jgi:hypothetical protein
LDKVPGTIAPTTAEPRPGQPALDMPETKKTCPELRFIRLDGTYVFVGAYLGEDIQHFVNVFRLSLLRNPNRLRNYDFGN